MTVSEARGNTAKELVALNEVANLTDLSCYITKYDLTDKFENVITRMFNDFFEEELAELEAYERAEQHKEDMFWERANAYLLEKDGI